MSCVLVGFEVKPGRALLLARLIPTYSQIGSRSLMMVSSPKTENSLARMYAVVFRLTCILLDFYENRASLQPSSAMTRPMPSRTKTRRATSKLTRDATIAVSLFV